MDGRDKTVAGSPSVSTLVGMQLSAATCLLCRPWLKLSFGVSQSSAASPAWHLYSTHRCAIAAGAACPTRIYPAHTCMHACHRPPLSERMFRGANPSLPDYTTTAHVFCRAICISICLLLAHTSAFTRMHACASLNAQDAQGQTALFIACAYGHVTTVNYLLANGADRMVGQGRVCSADHVCGRLWEQAKRGRHQKMLHVLRRSHPADMRLIAGGP